MSMSDVEHVDAPVSTTPSASEVRQLVTAHNRRTAVLGLALVMVVAGVAYFLASVRAGALDSFKSTDVLLANAPRSACITERRNEQADALGRLTIAANNAEAAGLIDNDAAEVAVQRKLYDEWVARWIEATERLGPDVIDQAPPLGCGAPVLKLDDLPGD